MVSSLLDRRIMQIAGSNFDGNANQISWTMTINRGKLKSKSATKLVDSAPKIWRIRFMGA
jgi:hypothetical protein